MRKILATICLLLLLPYYASAFTLGMMTEATNCTDQPGDKLDIAPGLSTGNALPPPFIVWGAAMTPTSGTTAQTRVKRSIRGIHKVLTNTWVQSLITLPFASDGIASGHLRCLVEVKNSTNYQARSVSTMYTVINRSGALTSAWQADTDVALNSPTGGSLTVTLTATSGSAPGYIQIQTDSSLSSISTGYPRVTCSLENLGQFDVTITP